MKTTLMPLSVCILCATSAFSGALRPAAHGTNAEWYNTVCSNVFEAAEEGPGAVPSMADFVKEVMGMSPQKLHGAMQIVL